MSISTLVAAGTALVTVRQASGEQGLTRDGQVTDRYTAAVANLGNSSEEVRIGGLYALQRIAQDSPRDAPTIAQVISAYLRSHAPLPQKGTTAPAHPTNDVAAALSILTRPLAKDEPADLSQTELSGANLLPPIVHKITRSHLEGANLSYADLERANLSLVDLEGANLQGADLSKADLRNANLEGANLMFADLSNAALLGVNLKGASLTGVRGYPPPGQG
ncbi:pentapeptide repeat-containing protein [Streptomyces sp. NPDC127172]|uniref:pentapeptide repeat-containing protein n=1 Tax=Streptomyces sp. NPDC127172 TaxID=3345382 RepID=UPI0036293E08